jgi:hypothetical protein
VIARICLIGKRVGDFVEIDSHEIPIEAVNGLIRRLRPGPGAASLAPKLRILWSTSRAAIKNRINLLSEDRL